MRMVLASLVIAVWLAACGGGSPPEAPPAPDVVAAPTPSPTASPTPSPTPTPTPSPSPQPPGPSAGSFIWGANGHPFNAYPDIPWEQQLDLVKQANLTHYRVNIQDESKVDGFERMLAMAEARGVTLLPVIFQPGSLDRDSAEVIYANSRALAERVSRRFAGRVKVWELENELENYAIIRPCEMRDDGTQYPCEWGPAGGVGPLEYYGPRWKKVSAALKGLSDGLKVGDPTARRAIGTAGWGHSGAFARMVQDGVEWEISVWHAYQINEELIKVVAGYGKPIWITEFNSGDPMSDDEGVQAANVQKMLDRFKAIRQANRIEAIFFYELLDEPYWTDFEGRQGMLHLDRQANGRWKVGTPKPVHEVVKRAAAGG